MKEQSRILMTIVAVVAMMMSANKINSTKEAK